MVIGFSIFILVEVLELLFLIVLAWCPKVVLEDSVSPAILVTPLLTHLVELSLAYNINNVLRLLHLFWAAVSIIHGWVLVENMLHPLLNDSTAHFFVTHSYEINID